MTSTKQIIEVTQVAGFHINEMMEHNEEQGSFTCSGEWWRL